MIMTEDLKHTTEFQLAMQVESAINRFNFKPERFAAAICYMHPTVQQSFYRLIKECIKVLADESRSIDDRNRASHEDAKCMLEYLNKNGKYIPMV